jgi:hypothetical protein
MLVVTSSARQPELGALLMDVTLTEEVRLEADVTQFWVEDGTIISDHVSQGPKNVRIAGVIATADIGAYSFGNNGDAKVVDVMETLDRIHAERALVTISTGQMQYTDMAFFNLTATRTADADGGNWLSITADARKVRKVGLRTAEVPADNVRQTDPAAGRAGQTNKPAGKTSGTGASGSGPAPRRRVGAITQFGRSTGNENPGAAVLDALRGTMSAP